MIMADIRFLLRWKYVFEDISEKPVFYFLLWKEKPISLLEMSRILQHSLRFAEYLFFYQKIQPFEFHGNLVFKTCNPYVFALLFLNMWCDDTWI